MGSSKKKGSSRARLPTTPTCGVPTPALSTVHAAGESADDPHPAAPVRKTSTASLASAAARSASSPRPDFTSSSNDAGDFDKPGSRTSWFGRKGTWPKATQKSAPVAKIASEHVSRDGPSSSATVPAPGPAATESLQADNKSSTKLSTQYQNSSTSSISKIPPQMEASPSATAPQPNAPAPEPVPVQTIQGSGAEPAKPNATETAQQERTTEQSAGWLGWWYGPQPQAETGGTGEEDSKALAEVPANEPTKEPEIPLRQEEEATVQSAAAPVEENQPKVTPLLTGLTSAIPARPRSWFGLWGGYEETPAPVEDANVVKEPETAPPQSDVPINEPEPVSVSNVETPEAVKPTITPARGYGWGFWSTAESKEGTTTNSTTTTEGELAVSGTPSETNPQKAVVKQPSTLSTALKPASFTSPPNNDSQSPAPAKSLKSKSASSLKSVTVKIETPKKPAVDAMSPLSNTSSVAVVEPDTVKKSQNMVPQNHVLPAFESCYHRLDQPSMIQQFTKIFRPPKVSKNHLYIANQKPRIKKAVAIGVHGFFPMRLVRTVLGEPTGTSIRFANHAASSIQRWAEKNGVEVEIEKIALEGEGKVGDRVEMLWKLLQNWMEHVRSADFVLLAAHSQGVVVGMQLLARLIEEGCVDNARIGFTAMAGINLGPFGHLPTTLLTGSARELFEFQKQDSAVSKKYIEALRIVLAQNVRILYVGSIDDQLVPLESSTITTISHPYIYRAVFVDGRVHAPDFLSHLVGFAMKLRNLGASDHGLIRELSSPLAGSLYGGEGHSRIYDDDAVYDLGVRHALETTDCPDVPLRVEPFQIPTNGNPYFLPWSLRGMLEETIVRTQLAPECGELLVQFENWKPISKTLKDVKFRLEGIRSKL